MDRTRTSQVYMLDTIRAMGMSVRVKDGEIRVNYKNGDESTAYYTNDRQDAVDTACIMRHKQQYGRLS